jgi:RNA polymerase sigma factor (sigma-70 family)
VGEAPEEFVVFCHGQYARLLGALTLYVGDRDVARELAQETVMRACDQWPKVRQMDSPGGWLNQVGLNLARSYFRRRAADRRATSRAAEAATLPQRDIEDAVTVRDAVSLLPPRQRQVVILRFYLGYPVTEIGGLLGVSPGTVKTSLHRGLGSLRRQFDEAANSEEVGDVPRP